MRQNTVCFVVFVCSSPIVMSLCTCFVLHEQCHICYHIFVFTINCFDDSGIKCNLFSYIDYIECLVIARNVTVTMAANHSICIMQLFQFKRKKDDRKWNNLRFICDRSVHQSTFFGRKKNVFFLLSIKWTRIDDGRHLLELLHTLKHVYICTYRREREHFFWNVCTVDTSQSTEFRYDSTQMKYIDNCRSMEYQKKSRDTKCICALKIISASSIPNDNCDYSNYPFKNYWIFFAFS